MSKKSGGVGQTAGYVLLGMLLLGLGGFGATNFGGSVKAVGKVGDTDIPAQDYFRGLRSEINAQTAQTGQPLTMLQARAAGIPETVLARLVTSTAMEHEAALMGISVGDARIAEDLRNIAAFKGVDGQFNRENYRMALENAGFSEREFEENLRAESAAMLLQRAIQGGVKLPATYVDTLIGYMGERRAFTWAEVGAAAGALDAGTPTATDDQLRAFYDEHIADYTRPETKRITYAYATPEMILDTVEIDEAKLREAYEERRAEFNMPERRLVERLVMSNATEAQEIAAQISAGTTTFEDAVKVRELDLADTDLGDVSKDALGTAGETVFAASVGDVIAGESNLGPALYRVNGVLPATSTSYEEALPDLRPTLAMARARQILTGQVNALDEELAAGVTLEELAETTDLEIGTIGWTGTNAEDIAGYESFAKAAKDATVDSYPEIAELGDGGIFALRVDEVQAPAPYDFDEIRDRVKTDWDLAEQSKARATEAETLKGQLADKSFEDLGLAPQKQDGLTRNARADQLPPATLDEVFRLQPGEAAVVTAPGRAWLVRLDEVIAADLNDGAAEQLRAIFAAQADQDVAQDLYRALAADIQTRAGVTIDQAAINAVQANFQ